MNFTITNFFLLILCYVGHIDAFTGLIAHYKHEGTQQEIVLMATYDNLHCPIREDLLDANRRNVIEFLTRRINQHWSVLYESDADSASGLYADFVVDRNRLLLVLADMQKKLAREWGDTYEPAYHIESKLLSQVDPITHNQRIKECIHENLGRSSQVHRFDSNPYVLAHAIRFLADIVIPSLFDKSGRYVLELINEKELADIRNLCAKIFCIMSLEIDRCYDYFQQAHCLHKYPLYRQYLEELNVLRIIALEHNMSAFMQWLDSQNGIHKTNFVLISLFNMFAVGHMNSISGNVVVVTNCKRIGQLSSVLEEQGFVLQTPNVYDSPAACMEGYLRALFPTENWGLQTDGFSVFSDTHFLSSSLWPLDNECDANVALSDYEKKEYLISLLKSDSNFFCMMGFLQCFRSLPKNEAEALLTNAFLNIDSSLVHAQICEHHQTIQRLLEVCHQLRLFWMRYGEILVVDPIQFFENPLGHIKQARDVSIANITSLDPKLVKSVQELMLEAMTSIQEAQDFLKVYEKVMQNRV